MANFQKKLIDISRSTVWIFQGLPSTRPYFVIVFEFIGAFRKMAKNAVLENSSDVLIKNIFFGGGDNTQVEGTLILIVIPVNCYQ